MKSIKISLHAREYNLYADEPKAADPNLTLKNSFELLDANRSGEDQKVTVDLGTDELVELVFDDDTRWLCPPDSLEEFFPEGVKQSRSGETSLFIPSEIGNTEERSLFNKVKLRLLNIFTKKAAAKSIAVLAKELEKQQLGTLRGLLKLSSTFELEKLAPIHTNEPVVLFIHGTNSSTQGSFAEIKGTPLWDYITANYKENNILAFQHETLTKSPLENVADLLGQLPANADLHIITHSRGGLVAEVLARCGDGAVLGFSAEEMSMLRDEERADDIKHIEAIHNLLAGKSFTVSKFIRVACPAAGTTILSKRLDNYFNISLNLIGLIPGLGTNPVYQSMKSLLIAVIDQKNDVNVLPGLEAMKPDSPFINIINNQSSSITISTAVYAISGNCKAKPNLKALLILSSKLFYLEDNDLVVNTKSMYCGTKRANKLQYFFDENNDVDHFRYFKNKRTNEAILSALKRGTDAASGFAAYTRGTFTEADRGALLNLEGGRYVSDKISGKRPIVILLPGIMGSTLGRDSDLIWINYWRFLTGGLKQLSLDKRTLKADAVIKTSYEKLAEELKKDYDVLTFSFDWRRSLTEAASLFNDKVTELIKHGQPIKIIGHSMGGVLVRDFMVFHPDTWSKLNNSVGFQLLFLGSPLGGSYRINAVLFGEDDIIDKLSKIDVIHTKRRLVEMFIRFPGVLCLLPMTTDAENDFSSPGVWKKMKAAFGNDKWPVPADADGVLEEYKAYRDAVLQSQTIDYTNASYIAGSYPSTPAGYRIAETARGQELKFLSTKEGDQSVTWDSGIPKEMITQNKVYYVSYSHGALSCTPAMFAGIKEILVRGQTTLFSTQRPVVRGAKIFDTPVRSDFDYTPSGVMNTLLGIASTQKQEESMAPLKVSVSHGDLKYSRYPILAGHFQNDSVLYAEKRIDGLLNGQLSQHHKLGIYPGAIGTHQIFEKARYGFKGAIIIGLGEPGTLNAFELTRSVEKGVMKYLMNIIGNLNQYSPEPIGVSSLMIACGYGGLSFDSSTSAVLNGIANANQQIKNLFPENYRLVEHVEFVDYYDSNAKSCMLSLRKMAAEAGGMHNIAIENPKIVVTKGEKRSSLKDTSLDWWTRIVITREKNKYGEVNGIRFSIASGASREEFKVIYTATSFVESLLTELSKEDSWSEDKAKAFFTLLIPNDMKNRLRRQGNLLLVVDSFTAQIPWELLHDTSYSIKPFCVNAGMIRQYLTQDNRTDIDMSVTRQALVIGDPYLNNPKLQLEGALREAAMVDGILQQQNYEVNHLSRALPGQIINALFSKEYRIVHLAGHGIFSSDTEKPSGMLIGENAILTAAHIAQLDRIPQLVFLNCCYLGESNGLAEEEFQSKFRLAANLGSQFINIGTKAVVAAGWAINDEAAHDFCEQFYKCMFEGNSLGDAVKQARDYVYKHHGHTNTWGAYQVYGDPFYKLSNKYSNKKTIKYILPDEARTDLANLLSKVRMGESTEEEIWNELRMISEEVDQDGIRTTKITEYEARILHAIGMYKEAIDKYEIILGTSGYSISTVEQYCNCKQKYIAEQYNSLNSAADRHALATQFDEITGKLAALQTIHESWERSTLLAGAWKRKTIFCTKETLKQAIAKAAYYYEQASIQAKHENPYPLTNWITMEILKAVCNKENWNARMINSYKKLLNASISKKAEFSNSSDFWTRMSLPNVGLCIWLLDIVKENATTMHKYDNVLKSYKEVWDIMGSIDEKEIELQHLEILLHCIEKEYGLKHFSYLALKDLKADLSALIEG